MRRGSRNYWDLRQFPRDPEPDPGAVGRDAAAISRLHAEVWRRFHAQPRPLPGTLVTPRMLRVLRHLAAAGPLSLGRLAERLEMARATATAVVGRLEAKGLVERRRDRDDQRRVYVSLTESGRDQIMELAELDLEDVFRRVVAVLTPETRSALISGFTALLEAAEKVALLPMEEEE